MQKLSYAFIALVLVGTASPAQADETATAEFTIEGTAVPVCKMPPPVASQETNAAFSGTAITVTNLVNQADATVQNWKTILTFPQVMCNYSAYISVKSTKGGLYPLEEPDVVVNGSNNFLRRVDYTVIGTWGSIEIPQLNTSGEPIVVNQISGGPNQADLVLEISTPNSNDPLVTATYQDTLVVQVGLQM
jgi:hypothetical protein